MKTRQVINGDVTSKSMSLDQRVWHRHKDKKAEPERLWPSGQRRWESRKD